MVFGSALCRLFFCSKSIWFCDTIPQSSITESWRRQQKGYFALSKSAPCQPKKSITLTLFFCESPECNYWNHVQGPMGPLCVEPSGSTGPGLHQFRNAPGNLEFQVEMRLLKSNSDIDRANSNETFSEKLIPEEQKQLAECI